MKFTKETLKRAVRTFIQAVIAYIAVNLAVVDFTESKQVIKSALIGLAVSALSAGISAVMNLEQKNPPEQLGGGLSYADYVKKYNGKSIDYDGVYGVQCVDLADHYIVNCLGLKIGFYGNARDWVDKFGKSDWLCKHFTLIKCKFGSNEIKKGDIGVRCSGTYGHIFICDSQNGKNFVMYDENANGTHAPMTKRTKTYSSDNITHLLRPKDRSNIEPSNKPSVKAGDTVTFTYNRVCYKDATSKKPYTVKELTGYTTTDKAVREKGTKAKVEKVVTDSKGSLWIEYLLSNKKVYSCIYDVASNTKRIK